MFGYCKVLKKKNIKENCFLYLLSKNIKKIYIIKIYQNLYILNLFNILYNRRK